jgi:uncharacterized protein YfcZ (UPF0381/DUF406 family)
MDDILYSIEEAEDAAKNEDPKDLKDELETLKKHLQALTECAQDCTTDSAEVVKKFEELEKLTTEVNSAFTAAKGTHPLAS